MSKIGIAKILGRALGVAGDAPLTLASAGAPIAGAAGVGHLLGPPIGAGISGLIGGGERMDTVADLIHDERDKVEMARRRAARLRRSVTVNASRLAKYAPELYNQLASPIPMPTGSTVIGGEPNMDLVAEVAAMMGRGAFSQQM